MPDVAINTLFVLAGVALVGWILWDVYQTVVVPRATPTRIRLTRFVTRFMWRFWRFRAGRASSVEASQHVLASFAPLAVVTVLICWVVMLIVGYALVLFGLRGEITNSSDFGTALYQSGITVLTIGYGDVLARGILSRLTEVAAAGTGIAVLALGITYLFSLYGAFQRREEQVTTLDARAGAPPSGIAMLETYARLGLWDDLRRTLVDWEEWSARVLDTHLAYPILNYFRSSHDGESWWSAQGAVLDAAVLLATVVERGPDGQKVPKGQAIMTLKGGAHLVEDLVGFFHFADDGTPLVSRLEFEAARMRLRRAGLVVRQDAGASWAAFAELRSSYASRINAMAGYLMIAPSQWIGDRSPVHHDAGLERALRVAMHEPDRAGLPAGLENVLPILYLDGPAPGLSVAMRPVGAPNGVKAGDDQEQVSQLR